MNAVIIDDEQDGIKVLKLHLAKYCANVKVMANFNDPEVALAFLKETTPDIVFLDIEMPRLNGFDLLEKLGNINFKIIFVTAYDRYMLKAIKVAAFDYLIKPIDTLELVECINRIQANHIEEVDDEESAINSVGNKLIVPVGSSFEFIDMDAIIKCESINNYCNIYTNTNKKLLICRTLKYIEELLPPNKFVRVHSKYLIHVNAIDRYVKSDGGHFELIDSSIIPISRSRKEVILKQLGIR